MACSDCGISFTELAPRDFSFNSPYGACPVCTGLGTRFEVDPDLVVPDDTLSLADGALAPWAGVRFKYFERLIDGHRGPRGLRRQHAVEETQCQGPQARCSTASRSARCPCKYRNRYGRVRTYETTLRRHRGVAGAQAQRIRRRLVARTGRAVHARGRVPHLQGANASSPKSSRSRSTTTTSPSELDDHRRGDRLLRPSKLTKREESDRAPGHQGDHRAPELPHGRGARLLDVAPRLGDTLGRRGPAHPAGQPDRQLPGRGPLRARRALDRTAPARQPATHRDPGASARPRATRSSSSSTTRRPSASPTSSSTSVPGAGEFGGRVVHAGTYKELLENPESLTGQYLSGRALDPDPDDARDRATARD